ncbi:MAG TPA: hypothetical protein VD963_05290 [Phycisphaerales bacterium]|nr:hypothetical protein [Phycisphaerales bacterium]
MGTDPTEPDARPRSHAGHDLPVVVTPLGPEEIVARLDVAARRGRLAGYHPGVGPLALFFVRDFGAPFEGTLIARLHRDAAGSALSFRARVRPLVPAIFFLVLALSVWPGVWLMESFLGLFPGSASWPWSGWWYLPLTVVGGAWAMWTALRRSRASIAAEAVQLVRRVADELDGAASR